MLSNPLENDSSNQVAVYRILDANFNRCREGLRVVEEYLRFGIEDGHLAAECKQIRHALVAAFAKLERCQLHGARDTANDVGTTVSTSTEYQRGDCREVATANWSRVEQALRCLEEYIKVVVPNTAPLIESLRYRVYQLERATSLLHRSLRRFEPLRLYVLVDARPSLDQFAHLVGQLIDGGADVLQLREKDLADRPLLERARVLRNITQERGVFFVMNDRPDLAVLAGADGVHVGQTELTVKDARRIMGPDATVGVSTHCMTQARQAVLDGADYLGCGPTFPSATKQFQDLAGVRFLHQVSREIALPAFAIGGIGPENLPQVLSAGFCRIAVRDAVVNADDPRLMTCTLRESLQTAER